MKFLLNLAAFAVLWMGVAHIIPNWPSNSADWLLIGLTLMFTAGLIPFRREDPPTDQGKLIPATES